ncbi:MAG: phosphinothricin acetyltransferase [Frankiales bacterium]|jgi:phosphinothricin acetyltransferase|nr:phosphinothricin acetyltransferase [Frankiales bacterium]
MTLAIRPAEQGDLAALTALYNHYIATTAITFDIEPMTVEARAEWFSHYAAAGRHRLLVAHDGPVLVGYASTGRFAVKAAYETSVEVSVYVAPDQARRGIGTALYEALFASVADEDIHRAYAGITLPNDASRRLHERFGFTPVGVYREVGRKFGRYHDVLRMQREF